MPEEIASSVSSTLGRYSLQSFGKVCPIPIVRSAKSNFRFGNRGLKQVNLTLKLHMELSDILYLAPKGREAQLAEQMVCHCH